MLLTFPAKVSIISNVADDSSLSDARVRVAQLDRASGYGPEGREFESCRVHRKGRQ